MKNKLFSAGMVFFNIYLFGIFALPAYAQKGASEQLGCGDGFGPFAAVFCGGGEIDLGFLLNNFISAVLGLLTIIAAIYFFFQFITAGIAWIGAGGDKNNVEAARTKILNALIGLVVVAAAWILVGIIGAVVGIQILNPGSLIPALQIYPTPIP